MPDLASAALEDTTARRVLQLAKASGFRSWLPRLVEAHFLFPTLAIVLLSLIWVGTLDLIRIERSNATTASIAAAGELVNTYEAQVVRAVREIDQTLSVVKYSSEIKGASAALPELKARGLLPPDLLFVVSVVNTQGQIVATTRPTQALSMTPEFPRGLLGDELWVDLSRKDTASSDWTLQFGRPLTDAAGTVTGAVIIKVDATYFVSGYNPSMLGKQGVLALLGTDGVFRVRRTGESVTAGDRTDYLLLVPSVNQDDPTVSLAVNEWDGVRRFTGANQLYGYPLVVIVGLSETEQLAAVRHSAQVYLWRAGAGSALVVLFAAVLGRMSWQLARGRVRESAVKLQHAQRIGYLAYHDELTALPNRTLFTKLLSQAISQSQRHHRQLAIEFIDLDRFKQINDTLGHEAGDQLLQEVAGRLKACLRDSDAVARLGGDEFVVLLTELEEEKYAATVARKINSLIAEPFVLLGQEFRVTASIGISIYPTDGMDEQTLKKNADIAMYHAKEAGKNQFQFYSEMLNANSLERLTLESSLRHALGRNEFRLHYQAKREMLHGRITGMEALLRWQHPDMGLIAPMQFIPVAEETGLIVPIGKWVLQTACSQNVAWQKQGLPRLSIAVNLTSRQFGDEHLLRDVASILDSTGMEASLLELEIHESLLIQDIDRTLQILTQLKALGVKIAIDDFGGGYSSLATLQQFPLDTIKIDRSYIRDIVTHPQDSSLTKAIIAMGRSLSLTVVAQGVETREQAEVLKAHACDEFQGFYFNKPLSTDQFTELLRAQETSTTLMGSRVAGEVKALFDPAAADPTPA
jgi:diguanylate cyclase (GGDEF)-like protein